ASMRADPASHRRVAIDGRDGSDPAVALGAAVQRTLAAGSARIDATYQPARGPRVSITGRASCVGPESEVSASVGGDPPTVVRVTADGRAWLLPPGSASWSPVAAEQVAGAAAAHGWADMLRGAGDPSDVRTDTAGRIVRMHLARDRLGGRLDVRLSEFGTHVAVAVPP
ncbi:MAG TPA: hypothetical protein VM933_10425, partial [Acidimicrobiales bacterium]|nr:hypothetical protein [Acidimicrobiales bacterium]